MNTADTAVLSYCGYLYPDTIVCPYVQAPLRRCLCLSPSSLLFGEVTGHSEHKGGVVSVDRHGFEDCSDPPTLVFQHVNLSEAR